MNIQNLLGVLPGMPERNESWSILILPCPEVILCETVTDQLILIQFNLGKCTRVLYKN